MASKDLSVYAKQLAADKKSGALQICRGILDLYLDAANRLSTQQLKQFHEEASAELAESHMQMPSVLNILDQIGWIVENPEIELPDEYHSKFRNLKSEFESIRGKVIQNALPELKKYTNFISLSNSSTVVSVFDELRNSYSTSPTIYICESNPGAESYAMAEALNALNLEAMIIPDMGIASLIDDSFCAVTGCDAIARDVFRNKLGSYHLALAAREIGIKYYLLGDSYKIVSQLDKEKLSSTRTNITLTEKGIKIYQKYFEDVPLSLVDFVITDRGVFTADKVGRLL
ncbi:MAG: hypothetical protein GF307_14280 [candidate division Zixibacteria bacterium]|nr:hypothetical protein [candidate division Zixibacteria bacterium]